MRVSLRVVVRAHDAAPRARSVPGLPRSICSSTASRRRNRSSASPPVALDPLRHQVEHVRLEVARPPLRVPAAADQPGVLEHPEVLGHGLQRDVVRRGQLVDGRVAPASRATMSRRVGSARAANTLDRRSGCSTMWLMTLRSGALVNPLRCVWAFCGSSRPGRPAKACARSSQRSASAPSADSARSARARRWVTRRQRSSAGPVTRWAASGGPHVHRIAGRAGQLHPERLGRRRLPVHGEGEVPGPHPEVGDGAQPGGRRRGQAERVADVDAVGPGLHEAGGRHRRGAHRWSVPRQRRARRQGEPGPPAAPHVRCATARAGLPAAPARRLCCGVHCGAHVLGGSRRSAEPVRVGRRLQRRVVGPGQVRHLVRDGPPRCRCGRPRHPASDQAGDRVVQRSALGGQVVEQTGEQVRGPPCATRCRRRSGPVQATP